MSHDPVLNFAKVIVSTGYAASVTSIVLESGQGAKLPDPSTAGAFNLVWWDSTSYSNPTDDPSVEIVRVTGRSSDTLTVVRAQEGTSDVNHNTNGKVYRMILSLTKKVYDDLAAGVFAIGRFTTGIYDNAGTPVLNIDTGNRKLYASDGIDEILNWATAGTAQFNDTNIITSGTLDAGAITGTSLTDGTLIVDNGSITGGIDATFAGLGTFDQLYANISTYPSAPASASGSFEYSGDPDYFYSYYDYGYTHTIRVYAYKETAAGKIWSATYVESTPITDATTYSQTYRINWTWTAVTGATGYRVFKTDDYGGFDYNVYADVLTNAYTDDNANSGWPNSGYAVDVNFNASFKATDQTFFDYIYVNTTGSSYSSRIAVDGQIEATTFSASGGYKDGATTILDYVAASTLLGGAGNLTMTGNRNILAGPQSGLSLTIGQDNFMAGPYSGLATTSGSNDFFMGYYAGGENTQGSNIVYIGSQCGQRSTATGNVYSVAIGSGAYNCGIIGGSTGNHLTIIGALGGCFTSGSDSITLGYYAGHYQTTASNILLIDNQNRGSAALELTNSLIYGVFNSTVASQSLTINAGNVYLPYDNEALWFGTGLDAKMYYDGTNLIINPEVVGSGQVEIKSLTTLAEKINNGDFEDGSTYWTGTTGWYAGTAYVFTVTGASTPPSVGSGWRDTNSVTYTCRYVVISGGNGYAVMSNASGTDPAAPTSTLTRTSGSGTSPITYTAVTQVAAHGATGSGTLTQTLANMVTPVGTGEYYVLTYDVIARNAGSVTPSCGGFTGTARSADGTYTETFQATTTGVLTFTPSATTARFSIDNVSLKKYGGDAYVGGNFRADKAMFGSGITDDTVSDFQVQGLSTYHKGTGIVTLDTPVPAVEQIAGSGSFTGESLYFAFSVYAYWDTPYGWRLWSQAGSCDITTAASPDPYDLQITWADVTNADGYKIVIDNDDVNGFYGDVQIPHYTSPCVYINGESEYPIPTITYQSPYTLNVALNVLGELWVDESLRIGDTLTLSTGAISDSSGGVNFGTNHIYTTGTVWGFFRCREGTATAGTSPLKFISGTLLTAAEAGAIEFLTDDFYGTITTDAARKKFVLDDGTDLTATRVPYVTTNGRLTDASGFTTDGTDWTFNSTTKLKFNAATEYINSANAGYLDYRAATGHRFGDGTNYTLIDADGDITFAGTAGITTPHGSFSDSTTQTLTSTSVPWVMTYDTTEHTTDITKGRSGTVTISNASPAVISWSSHGLYVDSEVVFTTDGGLPSGLTAGTRYYVISAGYGTNSFEVSATPQGAAINTSTDGSGTHTGTNTSIFTVPTVGFYGFIFSTLCDCTSGNGTTVDIWFRKNGTNVDRSNTRVQIATASNVLVSIADVALDLAAGDKIEMFWVGSSTNDRLLAIATAASPTRPATPSTILTVKKIAK